MSDQITITTLPPLSAVTAAYSGRPGCACGCRGKYYYADITKKEDWQLDLKSQAANTKMIKRIYKIFLVNLALGKVYGWEEYKGEFVALDLHENRTYTLYFDER